MRFQVYLTEFCPYCRMARELLDRLGYDYEEIHVELEPCERQVMEQRSGRSSVPQIFFGDTHIGGYDDLAELHRSGELSRLVAESRGPVT